MYEARGVRDQDQMGKIDKNERIKDDEPRIDQSQHNREVGHLRHMLYSALEKFKSCV